MKKKTDRKNAQLLLRLMREYNFPRIVGTSTRIMNQLKALAMEGYLW